MLKSHFECSEVTDGDWLLVAGLSVQQSRGATIGLYLSNFIATATSTIFADATGRILMLKLGCLILGSLHGINFLLMAHGKLNLNGVWEVSQGIGIGILLVSFLFVIMFSLFIASSAIL